MKSPVPTSSIATDPTLAELWAVKDKTTEKYRDASEYFAYLAISFPNLKAKKNQSNSERSSPRKVRSSRTVQKALVA